MQYRHLFPMLRILFPFMAGIIVCIAVSATEQIPLALWFSILPVILAATFIPFNKKLKPWIFGISASCFLFISGYNSILLHKEILRPEHFSKIQNKGIFIAIIEEPLQEKEHSYKTILRIHGLKKGDSFIKADGRILTYFAKDSVNKPPDEGSLITFSGTIQPIGPPQNPGSFNYRKYMANNNVYHQLYLNNFSWKLLQNPEGFNLFRTAHKISDRFVAILNENGLKGREFAVASALIMGQSDMLDNETLQAYSGTGVMHILSVSGLHVGVIYIIINFLLGFMKNKGGQLILKTAVILFTIWIYALLTGMSPSVLRSAAMFTFISIGNATNRYVHIINSLAVSAFALLLIDPLMINNIGFQLSYIAILGIVFINKPIADFWTPKNRIAGYIWGLIAVSIAAQIATAPLAMLYFHQFPAYFIPANLVAIPLSFLAIYAGVSVLATSVIPVVSNILGIITNYLLFALNYSVGFIEDLPHSVLHITSIFTKETILIYLIIISVILFFTFRRKELFFISLGLILILSVGLSYTETMRQKQQKIIFYSTGKQSAAGFIVGNKQILLADSVLIKDKTTNKFQLDGAKSLLGISSVKSLALDTLKRFDHKLPFDMPSFHSYGDYLFFQNKRIAVIESLPEVRGKVGRLNVDYLWIRRNPALRIQALAQIFKPQMVIIDGSNPNYKTKKWMDEFEKAGIKAYSLKNEGAYVVDL